MYFSKIKNKITVKDKRIIDSIKNNGIEYVKFFLDRDSTDNVVIKCYDTDIKSKGPNRYKIFYDSNGFVKVNCPSFLREHKGKSVDIFKENIDFDEYEVFRICPINFTLDKKRGRKKIINPHPYFTTSSLTIPSYYINHFLDKSAPFLRVCFDDNNYKDFIDGGMLVCFLTHYKEGDYNYPLYLTTNGLRTKSLFKFMSEIISCTDKKINNFIYNRTVVFDKCKFGKMIFNYRE
jgi:hypothetical protein